MIFESGLITLFRTILIIVGIYYGLKILMRYLLPFLIRTFLRKQQDKFYNQNQAGNNSTEGPSERREPKKKEKLGDYVEYEEIDD